MADKEKQCQADLEALKSKILEDISKSKENFVNNQESTKDTIEHAPPITPSETKETIIYDTKDDDNNTGSNDATKVHNAINNRVYYYNEALHNQRSLVERET